MNDFKNLNPQLSAAIKKVFTEKYGEKIQIRSFQALGGGCIHHASKIETSAGNFFLKWNSLGHADNFEKEVEGLFFLRKAAGDLLKIPEVIAFKKLDETPGFLLLEYLDNSGRVADSDEKLGRGLARIHQFSENAFGFYSNNYCGATLQNNNWCKNWVEFYRENRLRFLLQQIKRERIFPAEEEVLFEKLLEKLHCFLPEQTTPTLIHGDLWSGNYMHTNHGPALIDPAASFSDREMEFGMILLFGGFSAQFFDAYNEFYPLDAGWKQRNALYQLYHILNHYLLFGGSHLSQAKHIAERYLHKP